jgi:hypothetical protein
MGAPFRIERPRVRAVGGGEEFKNYLDRLLKMIPAEVLALYQVGSGIIQGQSINEQRIGLIVWSVICLVGLIALRIWGTSDSQRKLPPQWIAVFISSFAFVIWVYSLGGPFAFASWYKSYIGSLLVLVWTFFVPIFYRGD